jgi:glycosyltransferase involved in cell wall biosynthesis
VKTKRLSICYAVPGHNLLSSAGPSRNALYLAQELSRWADVTVAFRRILEPAEVRDFEIVEFQPDIKNSTQWVDDAAVRDTGLVDFLAYMRALKRFVDERMDAYDVVLEKSWLLSGYLTALCKKRSVPGIVVENIVRVWNRSLSGPQDLLSFGRHWLSQALVGYYLREAPCIIAETGQLKSALIERWRLTGARIEVVNLGLNHRLFRPCSQAEARKELGISVRSTILLYAGVLDETHSLTPVIEAVSRLSRPALELHIVGDGACRALYEEKAAQSPGKIVFHGRVSHAVVPQYIASADLCLAPYNPAAFPNGEIAYSTLKIPEYMACARPVASVPSGHIKNLIQDLVSGFLFPNDMLSWVKFLESVPSRDRLQEMGDAARRAVESITWENTARQYLEVCQNLISQRSVQKLPPLEHRVEV